MSRLIDVDKAENDIVENVTTKAVSRVVAILQGQPTVEAIPKEWIEKQIQKALTVDNASIFYSRNLKYLIEEWEKENDRD